MRYRLGVPRFAESIPDGHVNAVATQDPVDPDRVGIPSDEEIAALVGYRFPGGLRKVERWENWLLTDCTQRQPMSGKQLHPVVLFHVPIQAASTSIGEIFSLCGGGPAGSVTLLGYEWEYLAVMSEDIVYRGDGGVVAATRFRGSDGRVTHDDIFFVIELSDPEETTVARVTTRWRFLR